ncbi:hypothetical protein BT93_J0991 [Corymbia citriodora subsp. variegata]|nr:hypothetical protein BT93_J0991 [Corymbia citriodora subsp. variegata]
MKPFEESQRFSPIRLGELARVGTLSRLESLLRKNTRRPETEPTENESPRPESEKSFIRTQQASSASVVRLSDKCKRRVIARHRKKKERKSCEREMELSLDLSLAREPRPVSEFFREVSAIPDRDEKLSKLDDYVERLEEEMRKIDPFKRELPLCMLLLNDAMERLKEERLQCKRLEFIRPKRNPDRDKRAEVENKDSCDQKKWMSSVDQNLDQYAAEKNPVDPCNYKKKRGAFLPFGLHSAPPLKEGKDSSPISRLTLSTPTSMLASPDNDNVKKLSFEAPFSTDQAKLQRSPQQQQQQLRKQRRCWSPEAVLVT